MSPQALRAALDQIGDRWTLLVVASLLGGPQRFGELQTQIPGIAANILSSRLKALEQDGLVLATPYQTRPVRFGYELTARGRELAGVVQALAAWADDRAGPAHGVCGTPLSVRWWCPTCEIATDAPDAEALRHL